MGYKASIWSGSRADIHILIHDSEPAGVIRIYGSSLRATLYCLQVTSKWGMENY